MANTSWLKQTDKPLFEDLVWSRPENKRTAGKLLIIGGNLYGFSAPAQAYQEATKAGIGTARVLLPSALQKTVGKLMDNTEFGPSTPSGSFGQAALADWLENSAWADGVLLAGDLGRNSETAVAFEKFAATTKVPLTITKDTADYFYSNTPSILQRPNTTLVISLSQLQKFGAGARWPKPVTFGMSLVQLVELLQEFTEKYPCNIVVKHLKNILVADSSYVSTTALKDDKEIWRVATAAHVAVWWLQNPNKSFEALTTAVFENINQNV